MRKTYFLSVALCLAVSGFAAEVSQGVAAKNVQAVSFQSESLGEARNFNLLLPTDYDSSERRYPALYLLHGYGDNHTAWAIMTNLSGYAARHKIIVVMPDASKSWYVNSAADPKAKFEDFIVKDLIPYVDAHYRTIPLPRSRAVAGLSMGGYGAAFLALKHYHTFTAFGSFSGALAIAHERLNLGTTPEQKKTENEIAATIGKEDGERAERDPFALVKKVPPQEMPLIYVAEGGQDFLLKGNREFIALLADLKIPYEYREISPRVHAWDFWDDQIRIFLDLLEQRPGFSSRQ